MKLRLTAIAIAFIGLSACTTAPETPPQNVPFAGLEGTSWQLVEFQSMDDAQGVQRPDNPGKYTVEFGDEGRTAFRLDCNRGMGTWRNEISNATGGSLTFGPLAVTKALCPEPSMGELLEKQLPYVRSFVIRDGHLNMALMADGGIIVWEPAPN